MNTNVSSNNTAFGFNALYGVTTGDSNVALGAYSMANATILASNNTAVGKASMYNVTTGAYNVAMGHDAMKNGTITGDANAAIGASSMASLTTGSENNAYGRYSLDACTTGSQNAAFGHHALGQVTTGTYNTGIGAHAPGYEITTGTNNCCIGNNAGRSTSPHPVSGSDSNRVVIGNNAITNCYIKVDWTVTSDKRDKIEDGTVSHGLDFVNKLTPRSFWFREDRDSDVKTGQKHYGFWAQDILELEGSDNVIIDNDDPESLKYKGEHLVPVLVNAIKELSAKNDALAAEVEQLKSQLNN